jgi:hypothetical protein
MLYLCGEPDAAERNLAVWADIDQAFSRPVHITDDTAEYAPTQMIAEWFKCKGYDGIAYKSSLEKGHNIALFYLDAAECYGPLQLYALKHVHFDFSEASNPIMERQ